MSLIGGDLLIFLSTYVVTFVYIEVKLATVDSHGSHTNDDAPVAVVLPSLDTDVVWGEVGASILGQYQFIGLEKGRKGL